MVWQQTPYTIPLAAAGAVSAGIAVVAYRSREERGAIPLIGILVAAIIWSITDGVRLSTTNTTLKILMNDVRFLGPILVTVSIFLFAAEYTNRDQWLKPHRLASLCAVHAVTFLLVWTNHWHQLVRQGITLGETAGFVVMDIDWGPWYYVHAAYSYSLLVGAAAMLVDKLRQARDVNTYRGQTITILVATVVPWGMNAAFIAGFTEIDLTPFGFTVTGSMFALAMFRYQILDLVPIARSTVVDNIDEAYLVLDTGDTIVDVNRSATKLLDRDKESMIGKHVGEVYEAYPSVIEQFENDDDTRDRISLTVDGETRYYDVDISPIYDQRDNFTGRVVLFRDLTKQERRKRRLERQKTQLEQKTTQLERQNERLEEFASIVSHDLRNPINVVSGHVELAAQDPKDEYFETMRSGLDRMEDIVDDVLTMAQQGQTVAESELIEIDSLSTDAWDNVDTKDASLDVQTDLTIQGDRTRLLQVFENLFRNALDHGPSDVTVTVGTLDDGLYIEDDGPGIPEDERDDVLEKGFTTSQDGTGLGLAIVQTAVEAHGWTLTITDGLTGGARFEITDVQSPRTQEATQLQED